MTNRFRACGFLIFRRSPVPEILLLCSSSREWGLPKGCQDPGESDLETAYRETWEESGIKKHEIHHHSPFEYNISYPHKGSTKRVTFYLGEVENSVGITLPSEHRDFEWMSFDEAISQAIYDELRELYANARRFIY
eukprot:sb/3474640/